jgi:hypothetical protein
VNHEIKIQGDADVITAWRAGLAMGRRLGLGPFKQACLSRTILELARIVAESPRGGTCLVADDSDPKTIRARVSVFSKAKGSEVLYAMQKKVSDDIFVGPSIPVVKISQIAESCEIGEDASSAHACVAITQARAAAARP